MAKQSNGSGIAAIVVMAFVAILYKTCQSDPVMRGQVIGAAKSGIDTLAALIGTVLVIFGGGGAVLILKQVISGDTPIEEWGWRFAVAALLGLFGLWVIGHAN